MTGHDLEQLATLMERVRERSGIRSFSHSWKWTAYTLRRRVGNDIDRAVTWIDRDELDANVREDLSTALEQIAIRIRQPGEFDDYANAALSGVVSAMNAWKQIREGKEVANAGDRDAVRARAIKVRQESGAPVEAFANRVGVNPSYLSSLESGKLPYGLKTLHRICFATNTSLNWLLFGVGEQDMSSARRAEEEEQ